MGLDRFWVSSVIATVGMALLWSPSTVFALGLGKLSLYSALDEPLHAEIELTAVQPSELKSLKTGLAPRADFEGAGVERLPFLNEIKYNVAQRPDGRYFLRLTTEQPVREPFLHVLLQVDWVGGRLIREYTALLDPPHLATAKAPEVNAPQAPIAEPAISTPPAPPPVAQVAPTTTGDDTAAAAKTDIAPETAQETKEATPSPLTTAESVPPPAQVLSSDQETKESSKEGTPAEEKPGAEQLASQDPVQPQSQPQSQQQSKDQPQEPVKEPIRDQRPATPTDWADAPEYGPVKPGENLWQIAQQLQRDKNLSPQQIMLALLKANQAAFINNNVNHLKAGKVLKVPDRSAVEAVPASQALKEFRVQYDAWREYKLKLASAAQALQVAATEGGTAKGLIPTKKVEPSAAANDANVDTNAKSGKDGKDNNPASKSAAGDASGQDLLKIVRGQLDEKSSEGKPKGAGEPAAKPTEKVTASKEYRALQDKVTMLEEAIESKEMENKELRERVSQIENQLKNTKRLIELENKELALAQKQADGAKAAPDKKPAAATNPSPPAPKPAAPEMPAASKAAPKPAEAKQAAASPPAAQDDLLATVKNLLRDAVANPLILPLGIGVLVIVIGSLLVYMRRRRRSMSQFEESILSGGGINSEGMGDTSPQAENAPASVLSEFSQGGMGNIHTDEVDPVAEAEVYLAYGRDEQAEEILKEAVVKDPSRHELRLKLLEIYHQRNDLAAFETVAEELYAALEGKGGKVWPKVEEMGRKMNPQNPLFRGGAAATAGRSMPGLAAVGTAGAGAQTSAVTPLEQGFDLDLKGAGETPPASELSFDLDFTGNVESGTPTPNVESGTATAATLDFPAGATSARTQANPPATSTDAASSIDLDFSLLEGEGISNGGARSAPVAAADTSNSIDFDLSGVGDVGLAMETDTAVATAPGSGNGEHEIEWNFDTTAATTGEAIELEGMQADDAAGVQGGMEGIDVQHMDEIATKLDLAKAYIDMGDAEGARSILDEVLAEGNDTQKKQAADLAAQIS